MTRDATPRLPRDPFVLLVEAVPGDCTDATATHYARQRVGEADEWDWRSRLGRRGCPPLLSNYGGATLKGRSAAGELCGCLWRWKLHARTGDESRSPVDLFRRLRSRKLLPSIPPHLV